MDNSKLPLEQGASCSTPHPSRIEARLARQKEFFEKEEEIAASKAQSAGYKEEDFIACYERWLGVEPVLPARRESCERCLREIVMTHLHLDGPKFNVDQWVDFDSNAAVLPRGVREVLPRPKVSKKTALAFVEAYWHLYSMLRAKVLHLKTTGKIDDGKFEELDSMLISEESKLQKDFVRINKKFKEVFGEGSADQETVPKVDSLTDVWVQDAIEAEFLNERFPELCRSKSKEEGQEPAHDLDWLLESVQFDDEHFE